MFDLEKNIGKLSRFRGVDLPIIQKSESRTDRVLRQLEDRGLINFATGLALGAAAGIGVWELGQAGWRRWGPEEINTQGLIEVPRRLGSAARMIPGAIKNRGSIGIQVDESDKDISQSG